MFELVLALAIVGVAAAIIFPFFITTFYRNFELQDAMAEMQQQGRFTGDLISREIRQTGYDPTGDLFDAVPSKETKSRKINCIEARYDVERIFEARPTTFHFLADLDGDAEVDGDDPNEQVRFEWVGQNGQDICGESREKYTLFRDIGSGLQPATGNIEAFNFSYFDEDENPISGPADGSGNLIRAQRDRIRKVVLNITARTDRVDETYRDDNGELINEGYRTRTFSYEIWLRNM